MTGRSESVKYAYPRVSATSLMNVGFEPAPESSALIVAPSRVLSTHALPAPPPATNSRPWSSLFRPIAVVRPSAPPGANGASAGRRTLPLKIVPSVVEETKKSWRPRCSAMPSGKTASPGIA